MNLIGFAAFLVISHNNTFNDQFIFVVCLRLWVFVSAYMSSKQITKNFKNPNIVNKFKTKNMKSLNQLIAT